MLGDTVPLMPSARLRLVDFLVRMWRLKGFWCMISPVPVTLKRFLALEFVLTFGIFKNNLKDYTLPAASPRAKHLLSHTGNSSRNFRTAKVGILFELAKLNFKILWGRISMNCYYIVITLSKIMDYDQNENKKSRKFCRRDFKQGYATAGRYRRDDTY